MPVYKTKEEATKDKKQWYFIVSYKDLHGNYKQKKSKKFATKNEAEEQEAKFIIENNSINENINFNELLIAYYEKYKNDVKQSSSYTNTRKINDHILPYFRKKKINDISVHTINQWQKEINNKTYSIKIDNKEQLRYYSLSFKQSLHTCLSAILNYGVTYYGLKNNVASIVGNFKAPDEAPKKLSFWENDEFNRFISVIEDINDIAIFSFMYYTGLRKGEMLALTWQDIDLFKGVINVEKTINFKTEGKGYIITTPKTKNSFRQVLMPKKLIDIIDNYKREMEKYKNFSVKWFVFGGIAPYPTSTLWRKLKYYISLSNVPDIRIHDFRHSHASLLINQGANPAIVAERLGHTVQTCLKTYSHMWESKQKEILNLIDNL